MPQPAYTFPANDHDTGIVSRSSNNFQGFPTNTLNNQQSQYIPLNGQLYPPKPVIGYIETYGTPYKDGPTVIEAPQSIPPQTGSSVPQVYPYVPGSPFIPPGSFIEVPQNQASNQGNDNHNENHHDGDRHDSYNQGQYQQNQAWNGGYAVGYVNGNSQGQVGPSYNAQTLTPAQYGVVPQNLRTNGGCSQCP